MTSYGWIECVGHADRSCYDLHSHSKATRVKLVAEKALDSPKQVVIATIQPNNKEIGKKFKESSKKVKTLHFLIYSNCFRYV